MGAPGSPRVWRGCVSPPSSLVEIWQVTLRIRAYTWGSAGSRGWVCLSFDPPPFPHPQSSCDPRSARSPERFEEWSRVLSLKETVTEVLFSQISLECGTRCRICVSFEDGLYRCLVDVYGFLVMCSERV